MRVRWTPEAEADRLAIWDYIAADDPSAAARIDDCFDSSASHLAEFPMLGRAGTLPGTRELLPHERYRLIDQVRGDTLWILALVHTARVWPPRLS